MTLLGLGFWLTVGLAIANFFGWITISWWLAAAPLLIVLGIIAILWTIGILIMLVGLMIEAIKHF